MTMTRCVACLLVLVALLACRKKKEELPGPDAGATPSAPPVELEASTPSPGTEKVISQGTAPVTQAATGPQVYVPAHKKLASASASAVASAPPAGSAAATTATATKTGTGAAADSSATAGKTDFGVVQCASDCTKKRQTCVTQAKEDAQAKQKCTSDYFVCLKACGGLK